MDETEHVINSIDLSAAFLLYEKALRERSEEVGGDAFLITGDHDLWTWDEARYATQVGYRTF